ncbi:MAG: DUF302 domain-containing protein [Nocardiaceae bacterium]|nr:DUF302 domain-containing protein [Nocardiaceae bacterium]
MELALTTTVTAPFEDTVARTRAALAEQGFGVLTEIDMKTTIKAKLGHDIEDYLILGACNPPLAYQALSANRQVGVLLPCNVVVRALDSGRVLVEAMNPLLLAEVTSAPGLKPVAEQAAARLAKALETLSGE